MFFGSADSGVLRLQLVSGVSLLLISATLCVLFFLVMSVFRHVTMTVPLLFAVCLTLIGWLTVPQWTLVLAPYVGTGTVFGMMAVMFQRLVSDRRGGFPRAAAVGDFPTVFGFSGVVTPSSVDHRETAVTDAPPPSEFSVASGR